MVMDPTTMAIAFGIGAVQGAVTSFTEDKRNRKFAKLMQRNLSLQQAQIAQQTAFQGEQIARQHRSQAGQALTAMSDRGFVSPDVEVAMNIQAVLESIANITTGNNQRRAADMEARGQVNSLDGSNFLLDILSGGLSGMSLAASIFGGAQSPFGTGEATPGGKADGS